MENKGKFTDVNGVKTHFFEKGSGQPLLLIHGSGAYWCAEVNWQTVIEPLSKRFRVVAPDQIGFGFTDMPHSDYSLQARAHHMIEFVETMRLGKVYVCGNSHGGWISAYFAITRPDLVKKLIIVNDASTASVLTMNSPNIREEFPAMFSREAYSNPPTFESIKEAILKQTYYPELVTRERIERALMIALKNHEINKARTAATGSSIEARNRNVSVNGKHISNYLGSLKMPVLIVWGRHDWGICQLETGVRLFKLIPNAEMHILPSSKHMPMVDTPERFAAVISEFLTE